MAIDFAGQVVVVTGAGAGLGRSHALGFAARGATVIVNDVAGGDGHCQAESVVAEITGAGGTAEAAIGSVTDGPFVREMIDNTYKIHGRIDVLINNAGILRDASFHKMTDSQWFETVDVHLNGTANITRAVWPIMRKAGYGRIVMTTSSSGLFGNFGQANYGAAKLAQIGLMNTLVIEGAKADVRVNAISPVAWTQMTAGLFPPAGETLMTADHVTPGVLFLASAEAPNGMILTSGGGCFAAARMVETRPRYVDPAQGPEAVAAAFADIADFANAVPVANGPLHTVKWFKSVAEAAAEREPRS